MGFSLRELGHADAWGMGEDMTASHPICPGCRYRHVSSTSCRLGAADKPTLCPRMRKRINLSLAAQVTRLPSGGLQTPARAEMFHVEQSETKVHWNASVSCDCAITAC